MAFDVQGISGPFREKLVGSIGDLQQIAAAAYAGAQNPGPRYTRWFGRHDSDAYDRILGITHAIHDNLTNKHITFVNAIDEDADMDLSGVYAYTYKRNIQIYNQVGSAGTTWVWMVPKANKRELLITLYHELSHALGNTDDLTYDLQRCQFYARFQPALAANNAENFGQYAIEFA